MKSADCHKATDSKLSNSKSDENSKKKRDMEKRTAPFVMSPSNQLGTK